MDDPRVAQYARERVEAVNIAHKAMVTSYIGAPPPGLRGDADRMVAALLNAGWTPPGERTTEHAVRMSGGDMCVRNALPEVERVYPLEKWIEHRYAVERTKVYRRRVVVVEDWTEVDRPGSAAGMTPPDRSTNSPDPHPAQPGDMVGKGPGWQCPACSGEKDPRFLPDALQVAHRAHVRQRSERT